MINRLFCVLCALLICFVPPSIIGQEEGRPSLKARALTNGSVELSWPGSAIDYVVEQTDSLEEPHLWEAVGQPPVLQGGQLTIQIDGSGKAAFYRLRQSGQTTPASIASTSPVEGETGVAVTRETIFRFDRPLAADAVLGIGNVQARFDGRQILSRVEVSSDRKTVTLFYLENLPASSRVLVTFDGSDLRDANGNVLDLDRDGIPGGSAALRFITGTITGLPNTGVIGRVYASEPNPDGSNRPLAGATVTVDGAEETLRAVTDTNGFFHLQPSPAGRFFVHVDGRPAVGSSWPSGAYYPFVGKAWHATAGVTNNLAGGSGEIYLPLIPSDALQSVSANATTLVTFPASVTATNPALAGVTVSVPPNNLFSENGTRGGKVGIAPVPPDRLPEPLPPGLNLPLVITIQTDGPQNFDRPVPVRFPNLPDPVTGIRLGPGEKSVLWSFNHDTGRWEPQGTMTITADGNFAETDPGVGVLQPGWHGSAPGSPGGGPCSSPNCDDEPEDDPDDEEKDCEDSNANGICDKDDEKRCELDRVKTLISAADCFPNFVPQPETGPGIGCLNAAAVSGSQGYRDCVLDPSGCRDTVVTKGAEFAIDCAVGFIPLGDKAKYIITGAKQLKCLLDTGLAYQSWQLCKDAIPPGERLAAAAEMPSRGNPFLQQYKIEESMSDYFGALFGSAQWEQVYADEWPLMAGILQGIRTASRPGSAGGNSITAAERETILGIARPANIAANDVDALIDHLTAGNLNYERLGAAMERFSTILLEVQSEGWEGIYAGYSRGVTALAQLSQSASILIGAASLQTTAAATAAPAPSSGSPMPQRALYYRLVDTRSGFELRGRLNAQGQFTAIVLRPLTTYSVTYFDPVTLRSGSSFFTSARSGSRTIIPSAVLALPPAMLDTDNDGLPDLAEDALGTDQTKADSDEDGLSDYTEVISGGNPTDHLGAVTGVMGSTPLAGVAREIAVFQNHAVVASETAGVQVLSLLDPRAPSRVGSLIIPGSTVSIASDLRNVVAGNSSYGLLILDLTDFAQPRIRHIIDVPGIAPVALQGRWAYAGTLSGNLLVADVNSGQLRSQYTRPRNATRIDAIAADGDWVFVVSNNEFLVFRQENGLLFLTGSMPVSGGAAPLESGRKLLVAEGRAYVGYFEGYSVIDISNPLEPRLLGRQPATQAAIHHFNAASPDLLVPVTSFGGTGTLALSLYDLSDPTNVTQFLTSFDTPGEARAAAIHRGLAYVADGPRGVAVLNFMAGARDTNAPTVRIGGPWGEASPRAEAGSLTEVPVIVADDTLVREVTLLMNGASAGIDGSYPFSFSARAPEVPGLSSFTIAAVATDYSGNMRTSAPVNVLLSSDATAPAVTAVFPPPGSSVARELFSKITIEFNEPLGSSIPSALALFGVGADRLVNTADDVAVPLSDVQQIGATLVGNVTNAPAQGDYFVRMAAGLSDTNGNARLSPLLWTFTLTGTRPTLASVSPSGLLPTANTVISNLFAIFSSTLPPERAGQVTFALTSAGNDGLFATADDVAVETIVTGYDSALRQFRLHTSVPIGIGSYRLRAVGSPITTSSADFALKDPRNLWKADQGGLWSDATKWSFPLAAGHEVVIDRPNADIVTTNRSNVPLLRSIQSKERFYHASGLLGVMEEGVFDALTEVGGGSFEDAAFTQGTFRFRGGLEIRSGSSLNTRFAIHDATLINEGVARWLTHDIDSGGLNSVFFNAPGAVFEIDRLADDWALLTAGSPRGRFVNAGTVRKMDTNEVNMTGVNLHNNGVIIGEAGVLEVSGYRGTGNVEAKSGATIYLGHKPALNENARIYGEGTVVLGPVLSTSSRDLTDVTAQWEVSGVTLVRGAGARFTRPLDLPEGTVDIHSADAALEVPSRIGTLRARSSTRTVTVNAPLLLTRLHLENGSVEVHAPLTISHEIFWERSTLTTGATLAGSGVMTINPGGQIGSDLLRFTSSSDFALSNEVSATISRTSSTVPAGLLNEGNLVKLGTGRLLLSLPLTNSGTISVANGILASGRLVQNPPGQLLLSGGEYQFVNVGRTVLGGRFGGTGRLSFSGAIFGTLLALTDELILPPAEGVLTLVTHPIELGNNARTIVSIAPEGTGQIAGTVRLAGTLRVIFEDGFQPELGSQWVIITSSSGSFANLETVGLAPGRRVEVDYPAGAGVILRVIPE